MGREDWKHLDQTGGERGDLKDNYYSLIAVLSGNVSFSFCIAVDGRRTGMV